MSFTPKHLRAAFVGAFSGLILGLPALAEGIVITDAYARSSGPSAKSGAVFMQIENTDQAADRLIAASTPAARRAELHTHIENADGVMQMREVEGGFIIPAGDQHLLARGGDHVRLMGLTGPLDHGATMELTLTFEQAGDVTITVPVDLMRKAHGAHMKMPATKAE